MINNIKQFFLLATVFFITTLTNNVTAEEYTIDSTHSFVEWRIQHLGFSWLYGRFNKVSGMLLLDAEHPEKNSIEVVIELTSIDSNHAVRDKHLRDKKYLNVEKYTRAIFKSTKFQGDNNEGVLEGILSLNGVEKNIQMKVKKVGEGDDPWGSYRVGFIASYTLNKNDFN